MNTCQCPEAIRSETILGERGVYCWWIPRVKTGSCVFKWGEEKRWVPLPVRGHHKRFPCRRCGRTGQACRNE